MLSDMAFSITIIKLDNQHDESMTLNVYAECYYAECLLCCVFYAASFMLCLLCCVFYAVSFMLCLLCCVFYAVSFMLCLLCYVFYAVSLMLSVTIVSIMLNVMTPFYQGNNNGGQIRTLELSIMSQLFYLLLYQTTTVIQHFIKLIFLYYSSPSISFVGHQNFPNIKKYVFHVIKIRIDMLET